MLKTLLLKVQIIFGLKPRDLQSVHGIKPLTPLQGLVNLLPTLVMLSEATLKKESHNYIMKILLHNIEQEKELLKRMMKHKNTLKKEKKLELIEESIKLMN